MRHIFARFRHILIFLAFFMLSSAYSPARTARWITADDSLRDEPNTWIEFRKDFSLKKVPDTVMATVAADTKYWLWINDSLAVFEGGLKRGPNPSDTYCDEIDIRPFLKKGGNSVRLLLWHFGKPGFSHVDSRESGLFFEAPAIGLVSDRSWPSRRMTAFQTAPGPLPNFRLAESNIRYDARLADSGTFRPSVEKGTKGSAPWNRLVRRPIPMWRDSGVRFFPTKFHEGDSGMTVATVRFPYNMQITPVIDLTDQAGGTVVKIETDHVRGGSQDCVRAEYVTRPGRQTHESLGWMNGDELRIIYPAAAGIVLHRAGCRETGYDAGFEGSFSCSDPFIERFWQKAMRTLYVNMRDNYFDCPDRERAQWWGDVTILMGQSFYQLSPAANALMRKAINELADWQKPDGSLFSPIPAENWDKELPAQMLAAISTYGFWYYYLHTGDLETMRHAYPAMKKYLALWSLDSDGLTAERTGGWPWGDWGTDTDMRLILAAWHYLALKSAVNIARITGNDADTPACEALMKSVRDAFNRCWNGCAYRHPSYHGATDDRVQALAVVSGIADSTKYESVFRVFESQEYASPYMEKYVMEALFATGHGDYALRRFKKRFGPMVADTLHTTLYEGWKEGGYGGGSTNHAWSGGMLTVIAEHVCGVRPLAPGWSRFEVCPDPVIPQCAITVPSVRGIVRSSFDDTPESFMLRVSVPEGTTARVTLPEGNFAEVRLDGRVLQQRGPVDIDSGNHQFVCLKGA